jgi:hypothetical protein
MPNYKKGMTKFSCSFLRLQSLYIDFLKEGNWLMLVFFAV